MEVFGQKGCPVRRHSALKAKYKEPNIPQTLLMLNGGLENKIVLNGRNYLNTNIRSAKSNAEKLNVIFLSILSRKPKAHELRRLKNYKMNPNNVKDLVWVLMNSNEFKFKR